MPAVLAAAFVVLEAPSSAIIAICLLVMRLPLLPAHNASMQGALRSGTPCYASACRPLQQAKKFLIIAKRRD